MTTITLPWPPAVNNLYMNVGKRRVRTARYDAWLNEATIRARLQRPKPVRGDFGVYATFNRPDRRRRDLDGLLKAPLDLLVKLGVIDDDSGAQTITMAWSDAPIGKPGLCRITITAIPEPLAVAA